MSYPYSSASHTSSMSSTEVHSLTASSGTSAWQRVQRHTLTEVRPIPLACLRPRCTLWQPALARRSPCRCPTAPAAAAWWTWASHTAPRCRSHSMMPCSNRNNNNNSNNSGDNHNHNSDSNNNKRNRDRNRNRSRRRNNNNNNDNISSSCWARYVHDKSCLFWAACRGTESCDGTPSQFCSTNINESCAEDSDRRPWWILHRMQRQEPQWKLHKSAAASLSMKFAQNAPSEDLEEIVENAATEAQWRLHRVQQQAPMQIAQNAAVGTLVDTWVSHRTQQHKPWW